MTSFRNLARKIYVPILEPILGSRFQIRRRAATTEDYGAHQKMERSVDRIEDFGAADFADLASWIFASSLTNHRVIHQRIDEGSLLWRAVKMSGGPILELGRAAGGSTLVLLGASGSRPVISIDRAPFHSFIAQRVFERPDVGRRLRLYRQSSREAIAESEFGMLFVDADHSYDGVCHDIATFWNKLKPHSGKPPLAAFHDAADNPISYVESVRRACLELLAEPGAARIVEDWGSMLVIEKTGDIAPERWYAKEDSAFWADYADDGHLARALKITNARLNGLDEPLRLGAINLLGEENIEDSSWMKQEFTVEPVMKFGADNPLRLLRETRGTGEHRIAKTVALDRSQFCFSVFLRPYRAGALRLSVTQPGLGELGHADFHFGDQPRVGATAVKVGATIAEAGFSYRNGYFRCDFGLRLAAPAAAATFGIHGLDGAGQGATYAGNRDRGFFINLSSVREIL
jgi:hypothetical protein